ncbi:DUF1643 domain-containing protein [Lacticaseibacillus porcinae]|uniref:DUF1643 domain-containing protein n=1 Tax=Lacticaseibacillus porcinae TaxID=1123687 RepID=UPI000F7B1848|nr:DUF1643 domain-containing protein [Lacticaseibacillus porcinae]
MAEWPMGVESECVDPDSFEEVPENERHVDEGVANYLRLSLTIDRKKLLNEHVGDEEAVVLMKNPSTGTNITSDPTLDNLVKYMPQKFGIINCVNTTPVVTPDKTDLDNSVNTKRLSNKSIQELNLSKIKALLSKNTHPTLILATGKLDDMANLGTIYDSLVTEIKTIRKEAYFEIKWFNQTRDTKVPTGCHPGYVTPSERPNEDDPARVAYVQYIGNDEKGEQTPGENPEKFEYILSSVEDDQLN